MVGRCDRCGGYGEIETAAKSGTPFYICRDCFFALSGPEVQRVTVSADTTATVPTGPLEGDDVPF